MAKQPPVPPPPYAYPLTTTASRRHGPSGYNDYASYKPWLRDEFDFRCFYCLLRERWVHDPRSSFSVEHIEPKSIATALALEYSNLLYACVSCNSARGSARLPVDVRMGSLGTHLSLTATGQYSATTRAGDSLIDLLRLNLVYFVDARRRVLAAYDRVLGIERGATAIDFDLFRYPSDLPDLASLRPTSNRFPSGVAASAYARKQAGALAEFY